MLLHTKCKNRSNTLNGIKDAFTTFFVTLLAKTSFSIIAFFCFMHSFQWIFLRAVRKNVMYCDLFVCKQIYILIIIIDTHSSKKKKLFTNKISVSVFFYVFLNKQTYDKVKIQEMVNISSCFREMMEFRKDSFMIVMPLVYNVNGAKKNT